MDPLAGCYQFLTSPHVKAWLEKQLNELVIIHLKLYEARVQELKEGVQKLEKARIEVQHKVDEEEDRYGRDIPVDVKEWIERVDKIISECKKFNGDKRHELAVFDSGYLPKPGIRYRLSREAYNITRKVNRLLQTYKHNVISYWLGPPSIAAFLTNIGYESFSSRDETIKKINAALKNPSIRIIGVHGWSGVGKTTLVKEVAKEALQNLEAKMFEVVIMANATRNPDIRKIQGQIADMLGMALDEESDIARAARIRNRLKNEKKSTLIILDDLWSKVDFNMLGIPFENDNIVKEGKLKYNTSEDYNFVREGKLDSNKLGVPSENGNIVKEGKLNFKGLKNIIKEGKSTGEHNLMIMEKQHHASSGTKTEETLSHYIGCKVFLISESKQILSSHMEGKEDHIFFVDVLEKKEAETLFKKMAGVDYGNSGFEKLAAQIANRCNGLPMSIVTTAKALKNQSRSVWEDVHRKLEWQKLTGAPEFSTKLSYDLLENEELKYTFLLCARMGHDALIVDLVKYCIGLGFLQGIYTVREVRERVYSLVGKLKESGLLSDSYSSDHFTMQDIVRSAALSIASKENDVFTMTKRKIDEWPDKLERYAAISLHHCDIIEGFPRRINCPRLRLFHVDNNDPSLKIPENFFKGMRELKVLILTGFHLSPLPSSIRCLTKLRMLCLEHCVLGKDLSIIGELKKLRILSFSGSDVEHLPFELKQLTKLQIFDISNCSKLREIPPNVISSLISLEELHMRDSLIQSKDEEQTDQSLFTVLSELRLLHQLTTLDIQIPNTAHLPNNLFFDKLYNYKIVIGDMKADLEIDFKMPEKHETSRFLAIQLKDSFDIHSQMGIKMLFDRVEILLLEDLKGVQDIFYCLNLKGFPCLKHLLIVSNSNIHSLINPKDRHHPERAFPKLESLYLYDLKKLDKICLCELSEPSFGKLKVIKINLCGQLKNVFSKSVVKLLIALETIEVSECSSFQIRENGIVLNPNQQNMEWPITFPKILSSKFNSLGCEWLLEFRIFNIIFNGQQSGESSKPFHKDISEFMQHEGHKLQVMNAIFDINDKKQDVVDVINLQDVHIETLPNLKHVWKWNKDQEGILNLNKLQKIWVHDCNMLENIFPFAVAKHLNNLEYLVVSDCIGLREIVAEGEATNTNTTNPNPSFKFPKLTTIKFSKLPKLASFYPGAFELCFPALNDLSIKLCDKLEPFSKETTHAQRKLVLFPEKVPVINKLKSMQIESWHAKSSSSYMGEGNHRRDNLEELCLSRLMNTEILYSFLHRNPNLESLSLNNCFFRNIMPLRRPIEIENLGVVPKLKSLKLIDMPNLENLGFEPNIILQRIELMILKNCPCLVTMVPSSVSLTHLTNLEVVNCNGLESLMSPSTAKSLGQLSTLKVINCESLKEIIGDEDENAEKVEIVFKQLKALELVSLKNLNSFCCSKSCAFEFPSLEKLVKFFEGMEEMSFSKHLELQKAWQEGVGMQNSWFYSLKTLKLENCEIQPCAIPSNILPYLKSLKELEKLTLQGLSELTHVWEKNGQGTLSFQNLQVVFVIDCENLQNLFPVVLAKNLKKLDKIKIENCDGLLEIVGKEEDTALGITEKFVFPCLTCLNLYVLPQLTYFYPGTFILECPTLYRLSVWRCLKLKLFENAQLEGEGNNNSINGQFLFPDVKAISNFEELILSWKHISALRLRVRQLTEDLKYLSYLCLFFDVNVNEKPILPIEILEKAPNLQKLSIAFCNSPEIFLTQNHEFGENGMLGHLKILTLVKVSKLQSFGSEGSPWLNTICEKLNELNISGCPNLTTLVHSTSDVPFSYLKKLYISDCNELGYLFTSSAAKMLMHLEEITIKECESMKKILEKEQEETTLEGIKFERLHHIDLNTLPNLECFYSGTDTLHLPSLVQVDIGNAPR
ncbi:uncharacterized protein LOC113851106 [Abrus precatorius]|uniref:Uncharacterized protein LOC113851106 n=1 Tax=Abrus precatorius TaxID=3816 RepID=A0A8B8K0U4_ABRPR|nr:uncharacterized protein LOC113851106 [Abrus precatorius]